MESTSTLNISYRRMMVSEKQEVIPYFVSAEEHAIRVDAIARYIATPDGMIEYLAHLDQAWLENNPEEKAKKIKEIAETVASAPDSGEWYELIKKSLGSDARAKYYVLDSASMAELKKPSESDGVHFNIGRPAPSWSSKVSDIHNALLGKTPLRLHSTIALGAELIKNNNMWKNRADELLEAIRQSHPNMDADKLSRYIERVNAAMNDHS